MRKIRLLTLSILILASTVQAQEWNQKKTERADSLFNEILDKSVGMGSLRLTIGGQTVYENQYGFADIDAKTEIDKDSKFHIGSISKSYTAALVLMAVAEKKLTLDTKLSSYYPSIENADSISIEHLLRHKSGIYNFTNHPDYLTYNTTSMPKDSMIALIESLGVNFKPGERMEYSNSGYVLLSFILEDVYEKDYKEILKEKITEPFSLNNTYLSSGINASENEVYSYNMQGTEWKKSDVTDASIPMGAGAIVASPADVNTFMRLLVSGKILNAELTEKMKSLDDGRFGMGLFVIPFYEHKAYGHTGGIDGFRSVSSHFEEENVTITLLSNAVDYSTNDIIIGVLSLVFDKELTIPAVKAKVAVDASIMKSYEGNYTSPSFPLDVKIFIKDNTLMGQATGQQAFPLSALSATHYEFKPAGLEIKFDASSNTLDLTQAGRTFTLTKE